MRRFVFLITLLVQVACVSTPKESYHMDAVWHKGKVEEAFRLSKKENKPMFMYWGAIWCPPCNEIKDQVFSKPRFGELMEQYIPVYLDGDTEEAQIWADKLQAFGYPTILVFSPEGKELVRISGGVNLQEFELALGGAQNRSLEELIAKAQSGNLDREGWKTLAYASWGQLPKKLYTPSKIWSIRHQLVEKCPDDLAEEKAILASDFLAVSADLKDEDDLKVKVESVRKKAGALLEVIFENREKIISVRGFVNSQSSKVLGWAYPDVKSDGYLKWKKNWLQAAEVIASSQYVSVDTRLWAVYPSLQLSRLESGKENIDSSVKEKVIEAALKADKEAQSKYERHSVISGAAYLLRLVKAYPEADKILKKELKQTDTPWYYQSSLSSLASAQGKEEEALKWAAEARKSAKGRATRLQWITNDLLLTAKVKSSDQKNRLLSLADEYYQLATELKDGFAGRNSFRAARVSKSLQTWKKQKEFKSLLRNYQSKCSQLDTQAKENCIKHFKELL